MEPKRTHKPPFVDYRNTERGKEWLKRMIDGIGKRNPDDIVKEMELIRAGGTTKNSTKQ